MIYSICKFNVEYEPRYLKLLRRSEKYIAEDQSVTPDFKLFVSDEEIEAHKEKYNCTELLAEYVLIGIKFYQEIISRGAFFLHSAALAVDDFGYMFTGPCGAGKSTHASLWREYFKENVISVNDDKPAIRFFDGVPYVCGTPFSGKHDINSNTIVKLKGICILKQHPENKIERVSSAEAMPVLMEQTLRPENPSDMMSLFDMLDKLLTKVPVYKLYCNISKEAVELSYNTMKNS
ncbi:MAG: hypothetical protein E7566_01025 [Ruminococcaceae bacterium]|nr:hypothetical protein [Oscillospiraceae bacterium]